jgi:polyhydroxyalkanoate synthesis regulator phasin
MRSGHEEDTVLDEFRRLALFTSGVAELTRHRAEQIVREMVKSGEVRKDQAGSLVKTVMDLGRINRSEFIEMMRGEIRNQIAALGLATNRDVERLERRVTRLEDRARASASASAKKTTVRKKATSKTTAKSTSAAPGKSSPARRSTGTKSTVDRAPVPPKDAGGPSGA